MATPLVDAPDRPDNRAAFVGETPVNRRFLARFVAVAALAACGATPSPLAPPATSGPRVFADPADPRLAAYPELRKRLADDPFGYFRFVNISFARAVCEHFGDRLETMPVVNLHGDAHIEQYAVTVDGSGLADFDDASAGPAVIDLVRFGTSVALTCREHGWAGDDCRAFDALLAGYRQGLSQPEKNAPVPSVAPRLEAGFAGDRSSFLTWVDSVMEPVPDGERRTFEAGFDRYRDALLAERADLGPAFFAVKRLGRQRMGFGSALDRKFLIRIEGATEDPLDDVVLEAKEVRDLRGIPCARVTGGGGAFRVLLGHARIGQQPDPFLAAVPQGPDDPPELHPFWIHTWLQHYAEVDAGELVKTPSELDEIAFDVGVQLGRGHVRGIASPLDSQLRRAQLETLDRHEAALRGAVDSMTAATLDGWREFRAGAGCEPMP